jgi:hypothetical protein
VVVQQGKAQLDGGGGRSGPGPGGTGCVLPSTRELVVASGYVLWDAPLWEGSASGEVGIEFLPHWHATCPFTVVDLFSHPPTRVRLGREASGARSGRVSISQCAGVPNLNTCEPFLRLHWQDTGCGGQCAACVYE